MEAMRDMVCRQQEVDLQYGSLEEWHCSVIDRWSDRPSGSKLDMMLWVSSFCIQEDTLKFELPSILDNAENKQPNIFHRAPEQGDHDRNTQQSKKDIGFMTLLKSCAKQGDLREGRRIHAEIAIRGFLQKDVHFSSAVINMYAKCGAIAKAQEVFDELPLRDVVTWNTLIAGYAQNELYDEALKWFRKMQDEGFTPNAVTFICILKACNSIEGSKIHENVIKQGLLKKNIILANALVDMYAKHGILVKAQAVFDEIPVPDVDSWNALLGGYVQYGHGSEALSCFEQMHYDGLCPDSITYTFILKACGSTGALGKGKDIHAEIIRQGLLKENVMLGTALVDMYAKCGAVAKAQNLFDELAFRNEVTFNILITGYDQQDCSDEALLCFELMQYEGLFPDAVTFTCILKVCGNVGATSKGQQIHAEVVRWGLVEKNAKLCNALVDMYSSCGALAKAQDLFYTFPLRNVDSWNAAIARYIEYGYMEDAFNAFDMMLLENQFPNELTFTSMLKACSIIGAFHKGEKLHGEIARQGLLQQSYMLGTALVDMYVKFGLVEKAQEVFDKLLVHDEVSWNVLIVGYTNHQCGDKVLKCITQMQNEGLYPNMDTFSCIFKACSSLEEVEEMHCKIFNQGFLDKNIMLGNALLDIYAKYGALVKAQKVFDDLSVKSIFSWNALVEGYVEYGYGDEAYNCFKQMKMIGISFESVTLIGVLKACSIVESVERGNEVHAEVVRLGLLERDPLLGTALVDLYAKCGVLAKAEEVFDKIPMQCVVSWNALIAGYIQHGCADNALNCLVWMQDDGLFPDSVTFTCIVKAYSSIGVAEKGETLHAEVLEQGFLEDDIVLATALVDMYCKFGLIIRAQELFYSLPFRDVVAWNALITGYIQHGCNSEALQCYDKMQQEGLSPDTVTYNSILKVCGSAGEIEKGEEIHAAVVRKGLLAKDLILGTTLVDMYAKNGLLAKAQEVFDELLVRDVVSWNAVLAGYSEYGQNDEALKCFQSMQIEGLFPSAVTIICILKACSIIGAIQKGEEIHTSILLQCFSRENTVLVTALVDMYAKCGVLEKAKEIFVKLLVQDTVAWNALIVGYAQHGHGEEVMYHFKQMQEQGLSPNSNTLTTLLNACCHSGLVDEAQKCFSMWSHPCGVPTIEHHTCMIDLFGRAGCLDKAMGLMGKLPLFDCNPIWFIILSACQKWGDVKLGKLAFKCTVQLDGKDAASYVCMSNIYAAAGMHEEAGSVEAASMMQEAWM